jgi:hypothetical protein
MVFSGDVEGFEHTQQVEFTIEISDISLYQNNGYDHIHIPGFGHHFIPGKPDLPSKIYSLAIPPNAKEVELRIETGDPILFDETVFIPPCAEPQTISNLSETSDEKQYTSDEPYPTTVAEFVQYSYLRKYDLVDIRVNPCFYHPLSKTLYYYPEITVVLNCQLSDSSQRNILDAKGRNEIFAEKTIANYQQAQNWYPVDNTRNTEVYDYVIITLDTLTDAVSSLVEWEQEKGRQVQVVTTTWIDDNYGGYDLQEKIRNFLRLNYPTSAWGIEDVLLVGHYDDVPMRRCAQDVGYGQPETDFYYAELSLPDNESWDADGDHLYGESSDPIDFFAEITVGRIPSSNPDMVTSICEKSVFYEQTQIQSYKQHMLLLGAFFWPDTDNAELMEEITENPWMENWSFTRMYESQSSYTYDLELNYGNVETNWSSDTYGFVNWAGHGSETACYEYYPSTAFVDINTCESLNNTYSAVIFADACSNQDTDAYNLGQAMMERGAVGFLGSTKVAYGSSGWNSPYDGSSQSLDYFFTSKLTSYNYSTGQAHQWALSEMYTYGLWYYNYYETFEWGAYLGNPNLWMSISPMLAFSPQNYDFGLMQINQTKDMTFEIWNNGSGSLHYTLIENCDWLTLSETEGISTGEHDEILITANTTDLARGSHHCDILIDTIEAGKQLMSIDVYVSNGDEILDIEQDLYDRGFPIRHAIDGDWASAQDFTPTLSYITQAEVLMRRFGNPEFDLVMELRQNDPQGSLLDTITISSDGVSSSWNWVTLDFNDQLVSEELDYFIVCPPAPSGVTTSFGYEWAYALGDVYADGSFWFTRDGGNLWRDLPDNYEFSFRIFGYE